MSAAVTKITDRNKPTISQPDLLRPDDDANAKRRELVRHLAQRGGFDPELRALVWRTLGSEMLSDQALGLLFDLLRMLARGGDGED